MYPLPSRARAFAVILRRKRIVLPLIAVLLVISVAIAPYASSPERHRDDIAYLDGQKDAVLGLTAAASAASALITAIPDDVGTPIANELSDLGSWLLIVLCALYLEKYLLTIIPYVAFRLMIPAGLALLCVNRVNGSGRCKALAKRLFAFCLAMLLVLPSSLGLSRLIDSTYQVSIQEILRSADQAGDFLAAEGDGETAEEAADWWTSLTAAVSGAVDGVIHGVGNAVEKLKNILTCFIEAIAVMVITCCVLPLLVIAAYAVLLKSIWNIRVPMPRTLPRARKRGMAKSPSSVSMRA